ncbi:MAG: DNA-binding NarL/FixJ family response regulator [Candidatus Omnitrophota bacterium]|jgi:DNA-binding NarL/FixJ family response regulator
MKIYVADSDPIALNRLEDLLPRIDGVKAVTLFTYNGTNPAFLKQYHPDIVIMDNLHRGVLDLSLLNTLTDYLPTTLKIIYTDVANKQYLPLCMEFGADHFLYKSSGVEFLRFILSDYVRSTRIQEGEGLRSVNNLNDSVNDLK